MYQPVWEKLKKGQVVLIAVPKKQQDSVIRMVSKEKDQDQVFKFESKYPMKLKIIRGKDFVKFEMYSLHKWKQI